MTHPRTRKELRACIFGTLLGDSYLTSYGHFKCEQVTLELINLKRKILEELLGHTLNLGSRQRDNQFINGRKITGKRTYTVTACSPQFKKYYKVLYSTGRKKVTASLLRRLTPEAIALWIMDDGYLDFKKSSNTRYLRICTDSYTVQEHNLIIDYFKTIGIECFIKYHKSDKNSEPKPRITFNGNNAQKLVSMIYPYVLPCFYYKIDLKYQRMDSINILPEYREAIEYITQNRAR